VGRARHGLAYGARDTKHRVVLVSQFQQRVRKARSFEQLPCAPSNDGAHKFICQETPLFELHVNAAASGIDSNAVLRGGNADYHTGLI